MSRLARRPTSRLAAAASAVVLLMLIASAPARANETVWTCLNGVNDVFVHAAVFGINTPSTCPGDLYGTDGLAIETSGNTVAVGQRATWQANAPAGLMIVGAQIPAGQMQSDGINDGTQYGGGFYWAGGGAPTQDAEGSAGFAPLWTSYFGWQVICGHSPTCVSNYNALDVADIALYVQETAGPTLVAPDSLWQSSGWIRGDWNLHFYGDSPSGLCNLSASINNASVASSGSTQDTSTWHQCSAPAISQTIHTWQDGNGAMPLTIAASDAAGIPVGYTKTIYIDNAQPTVSLSGPTDVPVTAGTQYVTATATAGPSGVDGIACSVDNARSQWYVSPAEVPVSGVGDHQVQCQAANNAVDPAGNHAWSTPATWSLKIGDPTESAITFGHIVNALRCKRVKERIKVPARWVTVRRHHKRVKVRRPAHTKIIKVTKCHPRTKVERVTVRVRVRRHGKNVWVTRRKRERVVLLPHLANSPKLRVGHGKTATVRGWLGNYLGVALAGQPVTILTAPNNGLDQFTPAAAVTTAADGTWTATLPPGPSRLIEAAYNGGTTTEPSVSAQIALTVPAKVLLRVVDQRVAWGGTIRLVGQLQGGYIPPVGALVALRMGEGSNHTDYGVKQRVGGNGRFTSTYTFGEGLASIHRTYWFQAISLVSNYPFAPGQSRRLTVLVGGHPTTTVAAQ